MLEQGFGYDHAREVRSFRSERLKLGSRGIIEGSWSAQYFCWVRGLGSATVGGRWRIDDRTPNAAWRLAVQHSEQPKTY